MEQALQECTIISSPMLPAEGIALLFTIAPSPTGDPGLLHLADNGGPTQTMALPSNSALVDAGNNTYCTSTDQRGTPRPQGTGCDLGAVELDQVFPNLASSKPANGE